MEARGVAAVTAGGELEGRRPSRLEAQPAALVPRRPGFTRPAATAALALLLTVAPLSGRQAVERLTLDDALRLAQQRSAALQALEHKVEEYERKSAGARANYFPQLDTQLNYQQTNSGQGIVIPMGSFGEIPELGGAFPGQDLSIDQGGTGLFYAITTLTQPVTHFFKIREGLGVAVADEDIARAELQRTRNDVAIATMQLYGGLLIARYQREAAEMQVAAAEERAANRQVAASSGSVLEVAAVEARVRALEARQKLVEAESRIENLQYDLADLLALPPGTRIELADPEPVEGQLLSLDEYVTMALAGNPEVLEARATVQKAGHGVAAARADYIPEVGVALTHLYQSSVPFLPRSSFGVGVQLQWTLVDFGKRSSVVAERRAQLSQAQANLRRVEGKVRGDVEKAYRQLRHAETLVALAREASLLRAEAARLQAGQQRAGLVLAAEARAADAESLQGAADLLQAELGYRLAGAELYRTVGQVVW